VLHQGSKDMVERISISIVESGFEPELFKSAFLGGWSNFETKATISATQEQYDSDGGEEAK
jgi:hypothetical protein